MNWWNRLRQAIRRRFLPLRPGRVVRMARPGNTDRQQPENHRPPFPQAPNLMAEALRRIFDTRDRAEERRAFRPVGPDGTVDETVEEWFRQGDELVARTLHTRVLTCSGEIVPADRLQGVCSCGGYDDVIARCRACGRPLCRLHKRVFHTESGETVLCDQHYRDAVNAFNTWRALDAQRQERRPS